jgi:uncharacterized membrane protein YjdF
MWAHQALSTHRFDIRWYCECMPIISIVFMSSVECKKGCECASVSCNAVPYLVLAMMRIYVFYKYLSWNGDQQQDLGKPNLKIAKPSHRWEVGGHPISLGEWEDSVCFEKGARMDSFAAVLTMLSCSSMYEVICVKKQTLWLMSNNHNIMSICVTDPIFVYPQVKNKP